MRRAVLAVVAGLVVVAGMAACGSDDGDPTALCPAYDALVASDPFAELAVASPGEIRDAFDDLAAAADDVRATATGEVTAPARAYVEAIGDLRDELAAAGYDPRRVDVGAYRIASDDYLEAAVRLERAARAACG